LNSTCENNAGHWKESLGSCERGGSVSSYEREVLPGFEDGYYNCFYPGRGECFPFQQLYLERRKPLAAGDLQESILL